MIGGNTMWDILIIGGGPAGLSAAVNCIARGKTCAVLTNDFRNNPLYKTELVENYAGMRGYSGKDMLQQMTKEAEEAGAAFMSGRVTSILPMEDSFLVALGDEMLEGKRIILCTGIMTGAELPGEKQLVGRGVSYCATCDGMLYRGKHAVVTGNAPDLVEEAKFLQQIGVQVTLITKAPVNPSLHIPQMKARKLSISGSEKVEAVVADGQTIPCDVVFVLRDTLSASVLIPGLKMTGQFIRVNRSMETNIPGVFAAGDCTGKPLQIAKAVGEGLIAAQNAAKSIKMK